MAEFGSAFLRPNFHDWDSYLADMVATLEIAAWGTALAVLFGVPFSILSAANVCPAWVVQPVRRLMDACRAINEIVFALMFVVAVGSPASWRWPCIISACSPSCSQRPWSRSTRGPLKESERRAPDACRR